ncbi:MAG: lectin-like domain-containing protein [Coprobacillaceae bacterium]
MERKKRILTILIFVLSFSLIQNVNTSDSATVFAASDDIEITKSNFLDYFQVNGDATYDSTTGLLNLTKNQMGSVGNASLNTKVDFTKPFTLKLSVNLGDKSQAQAGADGIGFVFHTDSINSIGTEGNGFGAGNLNNVVGFKLDTNWNNHDQTHIYALKDPNSPGYDRSFGAFMYTDSNRYVTTYQTSDTAAEVKEIPNPVSNTFRDFEINYDGINTMHITYDGISWSLNVVDTFNMTELLRSFCISSSTGYYFNLH